jgi:hypothetical protein
MSPSCKSMFSIICIRTQKSISIKIKTLRTIMAKQAYKHIHNQFWIPTQYGMYIMPSSAMNSRTPQWETRSAASLRSSNNIG